MDFDLESIGKYPVIESQLEISAGIAESTRYIDNFHTTLCSLSISRLFAWMVLQKLSSCQNTVLHSFKVEKLLPPGLKPGISNTKYQANKIES